MAAWVGDPFSGGNGSPLLFGSFREAVGPAFCCSVGGAGVDDPDVRVVDQGDRFSGAIIRKAQEYDIRSIQETVDPEWIIIEATGVAYPLEIKNNVEACFRIPVKILSLADAGRWKRLHAYMPQLIEAQVDSAECILLNKVDLVDAETADQIVGELRAYNPKAELHKIVANKPIDDSVWAFLER